MQSANYCREQSAEYLVLADEAPSGRESATLKNIAYSWARLAGQIERYETLLREPPPVPGFPESTELPAGL